MPGTVVKVGNVAVKRRSARLRRGEGAAARGPEGAAAAAAAPARREPEDFSFSDVDGDSDDGDRDKRDEGDAGDAGAANVKENAGAAAANNSRKRRSAAEVIRANKAARARKQQQQPRQKPKYPKGVAFAVDEAMLASDGPKLGQWVHEALETIMENELKALENVYTGEYASVLDDLRQSGEKVLRRVHKEMTGKNGAALDDQMERPQPKANPKNQQNRQREAELRALIDDFKRELDEWKRVEEARCQQHRQDQQARAKSAPADPVAAPPAQAPAAAQPALPAGDFDEAFDSTMGKTVAQLEVLNARLRAVKALALAGKQTSAKLAQRVDKDAFEAYESRGKPNKLIKALAADQER